MAPTCWSTPATTSARSTELHRPTSAARNLRTTGGVGGAGNHCSVTTGLPGRPKLSGGETCVETAPAPHTSRKSEAPGQVMRMRNTRWRSLRRSLLHTAHRNHLRRAGPDAYASQSVVLTGDVDVAVPVVSERLQPARWHRASPSSAAPHHRRSALTWQCDRYVTRSLKAARPGRSSVFPPGLFETSTQPAPGRARSLPPLPRRLPGAPPLYSSTSPVYAERSAGFSLRPALRDGSGARISTPRSSIYIQSASSSAGPTTVVAENR
jgi:hypothetical protein